jgi:C4-dicarboxylate-binding protein DctP
MREINAGAQANGFYVPATGVSQGFRAHTNKVRPIRHPDDLKGLKMRVPSQDVFVQTARAFGANPQEISAVETYQAIQTGVVDGQDNPPSNIWDYKFHEVCDYMTITNYATGPDPLIVNLKWYQRLPADLQQVFDEVSQEAMQLSDKLNREKEQEFIAMLADDVEVNYVEGNDLKPFQEAVESVYQGYIERGEFTREEIDRAKSVARGK